MKYKVINECNAVEYYEQFIEANSEDEAIEKAIDSGERNHMDSACEDSITYIGK